MPRKNFRPNNDSIKAPLLNPAGDEVGNLVLVFGYSATLRGELPVENSYDRCSLRMGKRDGDEQYMELHVYKGRNPHAGFVQNNRNGKLRFDEPFKIFDGINALRFDIIYDDTDTRYDDVLYVDRDNETGLWERVILEP